MKAHWEQVHAELTALAAMLTRGGELDLEGFARGFARAARGYLTAVEAEGMTSSRLRAVVKALDLRTKKSELARFLGGS